MNTINKITISLKWNWAGNVPWMSDNLINMQRNEMNGIKTGNVSQINEYAKERT